jgi:hypothetical protein
VVLEREFSPKKKYNEPDINKAKDIVEQLLSNPGLKSKPLIVREEIIIDYFSQNLPALKVMLEGSGLLPHIELDQALELIYRNLFGKVSGAVLPVINHFIEKSDFLFFDKLSETGTTSEIFRKEKLHDFVQVIFNDRYARSNMNGVVNIFIYKVLERYIGEIVRRRDFLYNELFTVQKTVYSPEDYLVFLKVVLLIKNAAYLNISAKPLSRYLNMNVNNFNQNTDNLTAYIDSMKKYIMPLLPGFPESVIDLAVKCNLPDFMTKDEEACCKFLYIINARFQDYKDIMKPDRGSESPDKSWFQIAEKNSGYFGYNSKIIEALNAIAGDNNW